MDSNIISLPFGGNQREDYRYGLYFHKQTAPGDAVYARPIIILRNVFGDIVRFTGFHAYAKPYSGRISVPLTSSSNEKLYHVCAMLNYILIEQYEQFKIDHVFHVTREALDTFFQCYAYAPGAGDKFRSHTTIERCVNNVADFIRHLKSNFGGYVELGPDNLFEGKTVRNRYG